MLALSASNSHSNECRFVFSGDRRCVTAASDQGWTGWYLGAQSVRRLRAPATAATRADSASKLAPRKAAGHARPASEPQAVSRVGHDAPFVGYPSSHGVPTQAGSQRARRTPRRRHDHPGHPGGVGLPRTQENPGSWRPLFSALTGPRMTAATGEHERSLEGRARSHSPTRRYSSRIRRHRATELTHKPRSAPVADQLALARPRVGEPVSAI